MATVTITIRDTPEGDLDAGIESEPGIPGPAAANKNLTEAQAAGVDLMRILVGKRADTLFGYLKGREQWKR